MEGKETGQEFYDRVMMLKVRLEKNFGRLNKLIGEIEKQENEITIDEYEENQLDADEILSDIQAMSTNYKAKQQVKAPMEEKEMRRQIEFKKRLQSSHLDQVNRKTSYLELSLCC